VYLWTASKDALLIVEATGPGNNEVFSTTLFYTNETTFELPMDGVGTYFELSSDGTLLYQESVIDYDTSVLEPGIYRYDSSHEIFLPLVNNAENIGLEDITQTDN
jgi:hypothetical protein